MRPGNSNKNTHAMITLINVSIARGIMREHTNTHCKLMRPEHGVRNHGERGNMENESVEHCVINMRNDEHSRMRENMENVEYRNA